MILIDLQQVLIAALMQQVGNNSKNKIDENLIRHISLNMLRSYAKQYKSKYGEIVICCDSNHFWRKDFFPFYKVHRKKDREASGFDWPFIFTTLHKIRDELKAFYPHKVLEIDGAEADDIIAILARTVPLDEETLIVSSDKDFLQLQKYTNISQFSPILKKYIKTDNPQNYVKEHIIKGDRGDGIPNILSPDNSFVAGERQKPISSKKLLEWMDLDSDDFCTTEVIKRGYIRNQTLIDLSFIPEDIQLKVQEAYNNTKVANRQMFLDYFIEKRLTNLIAEIGDF